MARADVDGPKLTAGLIPGGSSCFEPAPTPERPCLTKHASGVPISDDTGESASVVIADIKADNGVIHVIDKVLLPGQRPSCH